VPEASLPPQLSLDREASIERLTELMTAIRTEVHIVDADRWMEKLKVLAREKGWKRMLYGPGASIGSAIENAWAADSQDLPDLMPYTEPVETFKDDLFHHRCRNYHDPRCRRR
jgi:L-lactate dehydrogenase complex protein LldG